MQYRMRVAWMAMLAALAWPAYADIGSIGSPVQSGDVYDASEPQETSTPSPPAAYKHVLILAITFKNGQPYHYEERLTAAVADTETNRPGSIYEVICYLPFGANPAQNEMLQKDANNFLGNVTDDMLSAGVDAPRIRTGITAVKNGKAEIRIFISSDDAGDSTPH